MRRLLWPALLAAGCAPSRAAMFEPVAATVRERIGLTAAWRDPGRDDPRASALLAEPLTADSAAAIAVLRSPTLQAAYEELGAAGALVARARTPPNPQLEAQFRFPLDGGSTQIELSAVQSLTGLALAFPRASVAGAALDAARRRAAALTIDLAARARAGFYRAAAAERRVELRQTILEAAEAQSALAGSLHRAGNITELELTRATLFEEDARLESRIADGDRTAERERLRALLGGVEFRLGPLPDPPADLPDLGALERDALARSLDAAASRADEEAARPIPFIPDVGVGISAKREGDWGVGPIISLALPLFDWGQSERAQAEAHRRRARHQLAALEANLRAAARAATERLRAAHERTQRYRTTILPLRRRLVEESLRQYNAMQLSPFELLAARREQIEAERGFIDAVRDEHIALTEVEQLRAGSLPQGANP